MRNIKHILLLIIVLLTFTGCEKLLFRKIELTIDPNLPKDQNGFYYFKLYTDKSQNIHTINGSIRINGEVPTRPREKVEWESNLYWYINPGDTIGLITKTYKNYYMGQQTVMQLPPLISSVKALVPTINKSSYNNEDGSIHTVIAPIWDMKGDTMIISVTLDNVTKTEKIVLK